MMESSCGPLGAADEWPAGLDAGVLPMLLGYWGTGYWGSYSDMQAELATYFAGPNSKEKCGPLVQKGLRNSRWLQQSTNQDQGFRGLHRLRECGHKCGNRALVKTSVP